jgi:hypothetical protein
VRFAAGDSRAAIQQANLIPPDLFTGDPGVPLPYPTLREHIIDRLYDQNVGYWAANMQGLDHLSRADRAELLVDYLGTSEKQLAKAAQRMAADGKYELAASLLESSKAGFEHTEILAPVEKLVYLKPMEKSQNTDPFKDILYSAKIGQQTPQMDAGSDDRAAGRTGHTVAHAALLTGCTANAIFLAYVLDT